MTRTRYQVTTGRSVIRIGGRAVGTVYPAGSGQFQAATSGGRNLGYFRSGGAAERAVRAYAANVARNKQERYR